MFGSFFNTVAIDEYADWVVAELKRTLPAGFDPSIKNVSQRVDKLDGALAKQTAELIQKTKINIFKKARLVARVRDGMNSHGYPEPFVKAFSMDLIRRVMVAAGQRKS